MNAFKNALLTILGHKSYRSLEHEQKWHNYIISQKWRNMR